MNIYVLNNKRVEGAPANAQIIKASTRTGEFPEGIIAKVLYITNDGFPYIRCWVTESGVHGYRQTLMLENSWHNHEVHWFNTCCSGAFTLDKWHEIMEALKPVQNWIEQTLRNNQLKQNAIPRPTYSQAV